MKPINRIESIKRKLYKNTKPYWYLDEIAKGKAGLIIYDGKKFALVY